MVVIIMVLRRQLKRKRQNNWRRRNFLLQFLVFMVSAAWRFYVCSPQPRVAWSLPKSDHWWNYIVLETFTAREWMENFRVSQDTFRYLCQQLRPYIERSNTRLRDAVSLEKRVAITLWTLASPVEYRTVSHLFGVGRSTVCEIFNETCEAIVEHLLHQYITFPSVERQQQFISNFERKWGVPQCIGAIDGSHIPVSPPSMCHTDYYNRKGWYSVLVQAVVDYRYCFLDIYTGWPGSVNDARVFVHSSFYRKANSGQLLANATRRINNIDVPVFVIGDSAYPLLPWVMKPFTQPNVDTAEKRAYNYRICRGRIVVEIAFGRLKARWRRLMKRNDMIVRNVPNVIAAACVLHNMCEIHGDTFDESWATTESDDPSQPPDREPGDGPSSTITAAGYSIREALIHHFNNDS